MRRPREFCADRRMHTWRCALCPLRGFESTALEAVQAFERHYWDKHRDTS